MAKRGQIVGRLSIAILLVVVLLTSSIITGCAYLINTPELRVNEGDELYKQGRLDEAIDKYTEAIRYNPRWEEPYCKRGTTYCDLGQIDRGIEDLNEAIRLDTGYAEAYYNRGLAYTEQGKKAEAIDDFEKVISIADNAPWIKMAKQQIEELSR